MGVAKRAWDFARPQNAHRTVTDVLKARARWGCSTASARGYGHMITRYGHMIMQLPNTQSVRAANEPAITAETPHPIQ
jgi:hypothetical protein